MFLHVVRYSKGWRCYSIHDDSVSNTIF